MTLGSLGGNSVVNLYSLRFFGQVFESAGVAAIVSDLAGRITHANPAAERLLGWGPGELVGHDPAELLAPGQVPVTVEQVAAAEGQAWTGTSRMLLRGGGELIARSTVTVVTDDAGEARGLLELIRDDSANQRWLERLDALVDLGTALAAEHELAALLARVCSGARRLFQVDGAYLLRLDEEAGALLFQVADGPDPTLVGRSLPLDGPYSASRAASTRRPAIHHRAHSEPSPGQPDALRARSVIAVPLLRGDRLHGVLALTDHDRDGRFGSDDADLLQLFAGLAAVAIDDARLHEAERVRGERLLTLIRVSQLLSASIERREVFDAIAEGASRLLGADEVRLWLLETPAGPFELVHRAAGPAPVPRSRLEYRHTRISSAVRSGRIWQCPDVNQDPHFFQDAVIAAQTKTLGLHACLMVPLVAHGHSLGCLVIFSRQARSFDDEEVELARAFGNQAALAVQNAEALERERQADRLEQILERPTGLSAVDRGLIDGALDFVERYIDLAEGLS